MKTFLIDDDDLGNYLTETLLRLEGFSDDIRTFQAAEEALQALLTQLNEKIPQIIFLDLNMPVMNGWQFMEALAPYETRLHGRCRIYILTSSLALTDMEKAKTYSLVAGLIHKPIDVEEIRAIRSQLEEERAQ
ncbi:response regulator [Hymenobacter guriensis]|uniref:Response regulator n=1 Tax=Hymenobacter guriensis TaxID=2793065 RepID=A0ABS0L6E7_9BACT|nr:response regulator [Hymenobacter guriensis]MBG8554927.1 response regulator [Hymenobacter guriensis]